LARMRGSITSRAIRIRTMTTMAMTKPVDMTALPSLGMDTDTSLPKRRARQTTACQ
jgi:hypothetical protein